MSALLRPAAISEQDVALARGQLGEPRVAGAGGRVGDELVEQAARDLGRDQRVAARDGVDGVDDPLRR